MTLPRLEQDLRVRVLPQLRVERLLGASFKGAEARPGPRAPGASGALLSFAEAREMGETSSDSTRMRGLL